MLALTAARVLPSGPVLSMLSLLFTPWPPVALPAKPIFYVLLSARFPLVLECRVMLSLLLVTAVAVVVTPMGFCTNPDYLTSGLMCTRVMVCAAPFEVDVGALPLESIDVDSFCLVSTKLFLRMTRGRRLLTNCGMPRLLPATYCCC